MDSVSIGKHNPRLLDVRKSVQRGTLTSDGLLPIEGPRLVQEAYASGIPIAAMFVREDISTKDLPAATTVFSLDASAFKNLQSTEHSQGVIALVRPRVWVLDDVLRRNAPIVVLAGLQDPGNVGTILRVAESFGAAGSIALPGTASLHNSKVTRASAGSAFRLPCVWDVPWEQLLETLRSRQVQIVGTSPHAAQSIANWNWAVATAILIGNEGAGLSPAYAKACSAVLNIPHEPQTESLNSAIAAAIVLYEAYRQRNPR